MDLIGDTNINLGQHIQTDFVIKLKENIFVEEDISKNCVNYPHGKYASYNECDEDFLGSAIPPGLVPIWSGSNFENVTTSLYVKNIAHPLYDYGDLADGTQKSACLLPCSTIYVESRQLAEKTFNANNSVINLTFSQGVVVTKTNFLKFIFTNFLSDLGGCMGLWLGIGLLQAIEIGIKFLLPQMSCRK